MDSIDDIATPKHGQRFRVTVFDAIKNAITSVGDPFKQFHGIGLNKSAWKSCRYFLPQLFGLRRKASAANGRALAYSGSRSSQLHGLH